MWKAGWKSGISATQYQWLLSVLGAFAHGDLQSHSQRGDFEVDKRSHHYCGTEIVVNSYHAVMVVHSCNTDGGGKVVTAVKLEHGDELRHEQ